MYFTVVAQITPLFSGLSEKKSLGWFIFHWVVHLSCVFPIKAGRGGRPYIFTGMKTLNTLYKRFTVFFMRDCLLVPSPFFFCQGTCQKLARGKGGGGSVETEGGSQLFETQKKNGLLKGRGRVMQIYAHDHIIEVHSQKKKEVLYWEKNNLANIYFPFITML